jgi:hypothetical protein
MNPAGKYFTNLYEAKGVLHNPKGTPKSTTCASIVKPSTNSCSQELFGALGRGHVQDPLATEGNTPDSDILFQSLLCKVTLDLKHLPATTAVIHCLKPPHGKHSSQTVSREHLQCLGEFLPVICPGSPMLYCYLATRITTALEGVLDLSKFLSISDKRGPTHEAYSHLATKKTQHPYPDSISMRKKLKPCSV